MNLPNPFILKRGLIFFDLETTGVNTSTDRIIQFAGIKVMSDWTRETRTMLVNPTVKIPREAGEVHGITDDMVIDQPTFREISREIYDWIDWCDIAWYNSNNFDVPMLCEELGRCNIVWPNKDIHFIDVLAIERLLNSHKLWATYQRYYGKELQHAHDALADTQATLDIWMAQMNKLTELNSVEALDNWTQSDRRRYDIAGKMYLVDDLVYRSFGKYKGRPVHEDLSYCKWVINWEFPVETKVKLQKWIEGRGG